MTEWSREDEAEFIREMRTESDRGCVLLCAALIDRGLEKLLRLNFEKSSDANETEIDCVLTRQGEAVLINLTMRARFAHVLGLITRETCNAIREFANFRNAYAHQDKPPKLKAQGLGVLKKLGLKYLTDPKYVSLGKYRPDDMEEGKWLVILATVCLHDVLKKARKKLRAKGS